MQVCFQASRKAERFINRQAVPLEQVLQEVTHISSKIINGCLSKEAIRVTHALFNTRM